MSWRVRKKVLILNKYFKKYSEEKKMEDMYTSITSMKTLHGKIISDMMDVKNSNESNKLELLSDLQIISDKMSEIIQEAVLNYESIVEKDSNERTNQIRTLEPAHENKPKKLNSNASSLILFLCRLVWSL